MKKLYLITLITFFFVPNYGEIIKGEICLPMERANTVYTNEENEYPFIVEDTGFYLVHVKNMPSYWTFWKRWEPVRIIAAYAKTSTREILDNIDKGMPITIESNAENMQIFERNLLTLGCTVIMHELAFSFSSAEDAEYFKNQRAQRAIDTEKK